VIAKRSQNDCAAIARRLGGDCKSIARGDLKAFTQQFLSDTYTIKQRLHGGCAAMVVTS
jgi:hypothetical protein